MKLALITTVVLSAIATGAESPAPKVEKPIQVAATCFKTGEQSPPASMTKLCFYDCLGSPAAITIPSTSICPLTIPR